MKKIENMGNLPRHIQVLATELKGRLQGQEGVEIYEMSSITEFEKGAKGELQDDLSYEILPTVDTSTGRGYLVGFNVDDPKVITANDYLAKLKVYFVESSESEIRSWIKKIEEHRRLQQKEMYERRERLAKKAKKRRK